MAPLVLVVDHDRSVLALAKKCLTAAGLELQMATGGREALALLGAAPVDMIILSLMLPDMDGVDVCRLIRRQSRVPLLVMAEERFEVERFLALEVGADDCLLKPLNVREMATRARAHLRRWRWWRDEPVEQNLAILRVGDLRLDLEHKRAAIRGQALHLTPLEFEILRVLCQAQGAAIPRERLLYLATGQPVTGDARQVDVHIRALRLKLEADPANPRFLQTVRGSGYRVQAEG
ncbi:MAG: two-component response regulator [Symbiobacteriaceae bacterium]|jgi:DNA-binding response OmpR family regulator|nr:two-component response regulator [Symbiobacteriaceae bacterium]